MYKVYFVYNQTIHYMLFDYLDTATRFALEHDSIVEFEHDSIVENGFPIEVSGKPVNILDKTGD